MNQNKDSIYGEVILDNNGDFNGVYTYSAHCMYLDGSYILNIFGASNWVKQVVRDHVEELHNVVVTTITRG